MHASDAPSTSVHTSGGEGASGGHSDARRWNRCADAVGAVRWCGGWECTASSAGAPDAGMLWTRPPGGAHRVDRPIRTTGLHSLRARRAVESIASAHPRRRARVVRQGFGRAAGVLPGAGGAPGGWRCRRRGQRHAQPGGVGELLQALALLRREGRLDRFNHGGLRSRVWSCTLVPDRHLRDVRVDRIPAGAPANFALCPARRSAAGPVYWRTRGRPTDGWSVGRPDVAAVSSASCP